MGIINKKTEDKKKNEAVKKAKDKAPKAEEKKSMADLYSAGSQEKGKKSARPATSAYRVLLKPIVTEKASIMSSKNQYVFQVADNANKIEISKAIAQVFGIKPLKVNIISMIGKTVRTKKIKGKRKDWKKAIVIMPEGKSIDIYEGV
jgi:large subunit ribosomal protein L23